MKFVHVESTGTGFSLDPNPYLDHLEKVADELPPGARAYATDPHHYDFFSERCVKDLKLASMSVVDSMGTVTVDALFEFNEIAPERLHIRYVDVVDLRIGASAEWEHQYPPVMSTRRLGDVQLDEFLPHRSGCSHEIQLITGTIHVVCRDLTAEWKARTAL
jgi:hypothetical protein